MRWDREKGKRVLVCRTITKSDQWDGIWNEYLANAGIKRPE